jgi:hypothetical protein
VEGTAGKSTLDLAFEVQKSIKREPNTCSLTIFNLNPDHRKQLEALSLKPLKTANGQPPTPDKRKGKIRAELEVGYVGNTHLVFRGDLRRASSTYDGTTWATTIEGDDGGRDVLRSRVSRSFGVGTALDVVVRAACDALGIGTGNMDEVQADLGLVFPEGTVLTGSASVELDRILHSAGLAYSIQNGVLQVVRRGKGLPAEAVKLTSDTGLILSPVTNADGMTAATCLIQPEVYPGRAIYFDSPGTKGFFTVQRAKFHGDTSSDEWYIDTESKPRK